MTGATPNWYPSHGRLLREARTLAAKLKDDPERLADELGRRSPQILDAARRYFTRHYDRQNPAATRAPDAYSHKTMIGALELLHRPGLRDGPGVMRFLCQVVHDLDPSADKPLVNTASGSLKLAARGAAEELDDSCRRLLVDASQREAPFDWGHRLQLALFAFPLGADRYIEMLGKTHFQKQKSADVDLDWLQRFRDHQRFGDALLALLATLDDDAQRARLYDRVAESRRIADLLPLLAREVVRASHASHGVLATHLGDVGGPDAEAVLIYITAEGHRRALGAAVAALARVGTAAALEVLELAREAWDPGVQSAALEAETAAQDRPSQPASRALAALLAEHRDPTGWTFEEKQLLDLCAQRDVDNPAAVERFDPTGHLGQLLDLAETHYERDWGPAAKPATALEPSNMGKVAFLLGREPFYGHEASLDLLLRMLESARHNDLRFGARLALLKAATTSRLQLSPDQQARVGAQLADPVWTSRSQYELALMALPNTLDAWSQRFESRQDRDRIPTLEHTFICSLKAGEETRKTLARLYDACTPSQCRALLGAIPRATDPAFLTVWAALGREAAPTTRLAVVEALRGLETSQSHAVLRALASDDPDPAVQGAAMVALGAVGDRASLELLYDLREQGRGPRGVADDAIEAIRERHPAPEAGERGALSLGETNLEAGGLSVAAEAGGLALESGGEGTVSEPNRAPEAEPAGLFSSHPADRAVGAGWAHLRAPPRPLAPSVWASQLVLADSLWGLAWWAIAWVGIKTITAAPSASVFFFVTVIGALLGWVLTHRSRRTPVTLGCLRRGRPGHARLKKRHTDVVSRSKQGTSYAYRYEFMLVGEDGKSYSHIVRRSKKDPRLSDDVGEPVLYTLTDDGQVDDILVFDKLRTVRFDARGRIVARPLALLGALAGPALVAWAVVQAITVS